MHLPVTLNPRYNHADTAPDFLQRSLFSSIAPFFPSQVHISKDLEKIQRRHQPTCSRDYLAAFEAPCAARLSHLIHPVYSLVLSPAEVNQVSFQRNIRRSERNNPEVKNLTNLNLSVERTSQLNSTTSLQTSLLVQSLQNFLQGERALNLFLSHPLLLLKDHRPSLAPNPLYIALRTYPRRRFTYRPSILTGNQYNLITQQKYPTSILHSRGPRLTYRLRLLRTTKHPRLQAQHSSLRINNSTKLVLPFTSLLHSQTSSLLGVLSPTSLTHLPNSTHIQIFLAHLLRDLTFSRPLLCLTLASGIIINFPAH